MAKRWPFSIQGHFLLAANKQFVFQTDDVTQNFLEAEVKQNTKIKPKITYLT